MSKKIEILIADDHPIFREGLLRILEINEEFDVKGIAIDGVQALEMVSAEAPDVLVLDVSMPNLNGLEVAKACQDRAIDSKIILLTMHDDKETFHRALDFGVQGYVLKDDAAEDIVRCIEDVLQGKVFVSSSLTHHLIQQRVSTMNLQSRKKGINQLTPSERKILKLIASDHTSKEIAAKLGISSKTVDNHRSNICTKLELFGSHSLIRFAFDNRDQL